MKLKDEVEYMKYIDSANGDLIEWTVDGIHAGTLKMYGKEALAYGDTNKIEFSSVRGLYSLEHELMKQVSDDTKNTIMASWDALIKEVTIND